MILNGSIGRREWLNVEKSIEELLSQIISKVGVQLLKNQKKDIMVIIESSDIPRDEQFKIKKLINNSLHNSYKILKNQIGEFTENKEEYYSLVMEFEDKERSRKF